MAFWRFACSARFLQMVSLAAMVGLSLATSAPLAKAESSDDSMLSRLLKKKERGTVTSSNGSGHVTQTTGGKATTVTGIVNDGSVTPFLTLDSSAAMQAAADRYAGIVAAGGWPKVPGGKMKKGAEGKASEALNKRLYAEGYLRSEAISGEYAAIFTSATEDALMRFQRNHGLAVTGSIDGPTLNQLNVSAEQRLATIHANIPRVAEYSKDLGSRYMVVNIPAQQIETVNDGRVFSIHNAIVGRPSRPTPVVMTPLTIVRFNPYWNAPPSIVERDIVPRMLSNRPSKVMGDMNMKVFKGVGGPEISPDSVNWRRAVVDDYHFRQDPGGSNAMATAKIEFNSPFGIYLHDTPEPHLFDSAQRLYSSGCVRVEKVATLINWILQGQDGIDAARISELAETKERLDTPIANPPQLRVAYLTAWPTRDGVAAFRPDVYELDNSGFVMGQPLPVGEKVAGLRYVLKPVPRSQQSVDADEAFGFASLFRNRNSDKDSPFNRIETRRKKTDSLVKVSTSKTADRKKLASKSRRVWTGNPDKMPASFMADAADDGAPAKKVSKKLIDKKKLADKTKANGKTKTAKLASTKKVLKTDQAQAAAKPDDKTLAAKKKLAANVSKTPALDLKPADKTKKAAAASKPAADQCKPKDGKLPDGCKAPAAAKKPAAKPEKTASTN